MVKNVAQFFKGKGDDEFIMPFDDDHADMFTTMIRILGMPP
jgi:hypothetical protein